MEQILYHKCLTVRDVIVFLTSFLSILKDRYSCEIIIPVLLSPVIYLLSLYKFIHLKFVIQQATQGDGLSFQSGLRKLF